MIINCDGKETLPKKLISGQTKNIIFNVIHRLPDGDQNVSETFLKKALPGYTTANKNLFLAGDYNINVHDLETDKKNAKM